MLTHVDHEIDTGTVVFKVIGNIIISQVKPFIDVAPRQVDELKSVVDEYIDGDFGFVSTRFKESEISINPMVWEYVYSMLPNMKAFALVTNSEMGKDNFLETEKPMIENFKNNFPANVFPSVDEAYNWIVDQL